MKIEPTAETVAFETLKGGDPFHFKGELLIKFDRAILAEGSVSFSAIRVKDGKLGHFVSADQVSPAYVKVVAG